MNTKVRDTQANVTLHKSDSTLMGGSGRFYQQPFYMGFIFPLICLLAYSLTFLPFVADDALISLRYVQRFLSGDGLTWTQGIPVEGYSNLSWVLAVSALGYWGMDLILSSRLLAVVLYASILWVNWCYWRPYLHRNNSQFFYLSQYAFAFSATTGVWLVGGLEQPLIAASIAWALYFLLTDQHRVDSQTKQATTGFCASLSTAFSWRILFSSLALGLLCLTRPDSPLVCLCFALAIFIANGFHLKSFMRCAVLAIFPLLFVIGQLLFRLDYYDQWVATPALIKVQPSLSTLLIGFLYVIAGLLCLAPLAYYSLRTLLAKGHTHQRFLVILSATTLVVWLSYLMLIGGDIFPAFRHFTLVSVILVFLFPAVEQYFSSQHRCTDNVEDQSVNSFTFNPMQIGIMAFVYITLQWFNPSTAFARGHLWVWDGEVIANAMKKGFADQKPLLAVDAAGALPYWTGYPVIDMLGLNDYHIARTQPSAEIKYVGHQFGDGEYVYQKRPDIINFCFPKGLFQPCWKSGLELWDMPKFHKNYMPVRISGDNPFDVEGVQWFYQWSGITGIKKSAEAWSVPSYFFTTDAAIENTSIEKVIITRADENDIPAHLLKAYIADEQWQIDIEAGQTIQKRFTTLPAQPESIRVQLQPEDNRITAIWSKVDEQGGYILNLQSQHDSVLHLQRVKLTFSQAE